MNKYNKKKYNVINKFSISNKVFAMMILVSLIPTIILGVKSINQFSITSNSEFEKNTKTITQSIEQNVENKFNNISNMINYISQNNEFNESEQSKNNLATDFKLFKEGNPDVDYVYYYSEKNKDFVMYPNDDMGNSDYTTREWYKKAKEANGDVILTEVYEDIINKNYVVTVAKAIILNGNFSGVICADFNLSNFADSITKITYGQDGLLSVVDKKGTVIAHTNKNIIGSSNLTKNEAWSKMLSEDSGIVDLFLNDTNYTASFITSKITGWKILIQAPNTEINKIRNEYIITLIITGIILLIAVIILGIIFSKKLSKNIGILKYAIKKVANGDFTECIKIYSKDELEELAVDLNEMQHNISNLVKKVDNSVESVNETSVGLVKMSEEVSSTINQVAITIDEISNGSLESAENLQDLSENLDGVSEEINTINNAIQNINKLTLDTDSLSKKGLEMIKVITEKSNETKSSTLDVNSVVIEVSDSVKNIALMNDAIAKITEQTNLLALNAAIEAARAGESGKGFAVVADEIRKLAEQTAESAKEIDLIIKEVASNVNKAVDEVSKTNDAVKRQEESVSNAEEIFNNIILSINNLTVKVEEIVSGINEVTLKKNNVVNQVQNISSIGEETAAASEEVSASTQEVATSTEKFVIYLNELKELSTSLKNEIKQFKLK